MIVTGVQAAGSKGVSAVQVAAIDTKDVTRVGGAGDSDRDRGAGPAKGEPQPVVFPRSGVPLDQRPVDLRQQHAAARYRADGGNEHDEQHGSRRGSEHGRH